MWIVSEHKHTKKYLFIRIQLTTCPKMSNSSLKAQWEQIKHWLSWFSHSLTLRETSLLKQWQLVDGIGNKAGQRQKTASSTFKKSWLRGRRGFYVHMISLVGVTQKRLTPTVLRSDLPTSSGLPLWRLLTQRFPSKSCLIFRLPWHFRRQMKGNDFFCKRIKLWLSTLLLWCQSATESELKHIKLIRVKSIN